VRLRICASADERPGPTNSALAFAAAENRCLVLRRRDGSEIAALPFDDFAVEDIGDFMISMAPKLPTGEPAKDGSIMLAFRDDVGWEESWDLIAPLTSPSEGDVSRESPSCRRSSAGNEPHIRRAHRDIHAGKLQSSWRNDRDDFLRHDRHAASTPDWLPPISEEEEDMTGLRCGSGSSQRERAGRIHCRHHTVILSA